MKKNKIEAKKEDHFSKMNNFLAKNGNVILWSILGISILSSLLIFNLRVSEGGDDSTYIIRAYNLLKEGVYPTYQGPFYPFFLSVFIALSGGIKLGLLKLTSLFLVAVFFYLFHKAYKDRIEPVILYPSLLLLSVNSYILYFSSQTYSEAMFMALLGIFFITFFNLVDSKKELSAQIKSILTIAFIMVLLTLTRTIGIGVLASVILFYIIEKDYKKTGIFILSFFVIFGVWFLLKGLIWGFDVGTSTQATSLIHKHPYDFSQGKETFTGYLMRLVDNSNLYLSKQFFRIIGWRGENAILVKPFFTVILYVLFVYSLVATFRKNKYLTFTGIFIMVMLGITFISLQKIWDQYRLIVPYVPFMIIFLLSGLVALFRTKKLVNHQMIVTIFMSLSIFLTASQTISKTDLITLRSNIMGDKYKGYTNDWTNYLKMSEYAGKRLDKDSYVACRKPNMARIYADGKKFYGIYRIKTTDPDTLLQRLEDNHVTHIIMASLRKNPKMNTGQTINTIKRYMYFIIKKYPNTFVLKHKIGTSEPAYLFYIDYSKKEK